MSSEYAKQGNDPELMEIAKEPVQARLLRKSLEQLAQSSRDRAVREMADEVLGGRIGLREAAAVQAYADAIGEQTRPFMEYWESLSDDDREQLAAQGAEIEVSETENLRRESQATAEREYHRSGLSSRHSGKGWSLY